jgi:hypothetical protein
VNTPPRIADARDFGDKFNKWWATMQPAWRKGESLLRDPPANADWDTLKRGGSNGLALVVLTLSWWVNTLDPEQKLCARLLAAIEDLTWVLSQLSVTMSRVNKKRPGFEDSEDMPPMKKYVSIIHCILLTNFKCLQSLFCVASD